MKHLSISVPRVPWLRLVLSSLLLALLIAALIWLISSIHMNAGSWLGVFGLLVSLVMLIDARLP